MTAAHTSHFLLNRLSFLVFLSGEISHIVLVLRVLLHLVNFYSFSEIIGFVSYVPVLLAKSGPRKRRTYGP